MSKPVYSTVFIRVHALGGAFNYVVPVGFTAIVRDFDTYWNTIDPGFFVLLYDASTGGSWFSAEQTAGSVGGHHSAQWQGRQVFPAGLSFGVDVVGTGIGVQTADVRVSGYLLADP